MAAPLSRQLPQQNPWWTGRSWEKTDPQLVEFRNSAAPWEPETLSDFQMEEDRIYTLRGPRQVGKSTLLKLLISRALGAGAQPASILYLDCERAGLPRRRDLQNALDAWLRGARAGRGKTRLRVFLDEATSVPDWATALKSLADAGALTRTCVIATGSHALDLKKGGESMPGRRGAAAGLDKVLLPMSFREYLETTSPARWRRLPRCGPEDGPRGAFEAAERLGRLSGLVDAFPAYLRAGGYPRAVSASLGGSIPLYVYEIYQQSVLGTVRRLGHRESYFRELFLHWLRVQPNPLDWRDVSRETDIGKHDTVREYAEDLELAYFWDISYRSQSMGNPRPAFRGAKRICIKDPFSFHALRAWAMGFGDPWTAAKELMANPLEAGPLVESMVGAHLRRLYGPFLYYWRNTKEVDFLGFRESRLAAAVEVKWSEEAPRESLDALADLGGGILLTRSALGWDAARRVAVLPVPAFLAMI